MWPLQADQSVVEKDPYADLEDYSDLGTAATAADEAGPSSLALKENLQPLPGRISANTRGQQPRPGLVDTRTIAEPSLKGQSASGTLGGRLRNAAPKGGIGGTEPASFYGPASTQQPHAEDFPGSQRRQSSRVQKRKAEQVRYWLSAFCHTQCCHGSRGKATPSTQSGLCALANVRRKLPMGCAESGAHHAGRLR